MDLLATAVEVTRLPQAPIIITREVVPTRVVEVVVPISNTVRQAVEAAEEVAANTLWTLRGGAAPETDTLKKLADEMVLRLGGQINVKMPPFGAKGDGVTDDAPAFRRAALISGLELNGPPGDYLFDSAAPAIPGYSSNPVVPFDGIRDFTLRCHGRVRFIVGPSLATKTYSIFAFLCSAARAATGNYSMLNKITGSWEIVFASNRPGGSTGVDAAGINLTSSAFCTIEGGTFTGLPNKSFLGITGTGGIGHKLRYNIFRDIATCFDNSQFEGCKFNDNDLEHSGLGVSGFNHFYDTVTLGNIRLFRPLSRPFGSGGIYERNYIKGYGSGLNLRGLTNFHLLYNTVHGMSANDGTTRNMISIYSEANDYENLGLYVCDGHIVGNDIYDIQNAGGGVTRGIFINRFDGSVPVKRVSIYRNNLRHMPGCVGISETGPDGTTRIDDNTVDEATVTTPYGLAVLIRKPGQGTGLSPTLEASSGDLILKAADGRYVRFGSAQSSADKPIVGYVMVRDLAGVERKLGYIA